MDIESILDSLGLDLTNPETRRGAIEAIEAILDSRMPPMDFDGGADGGGQEQDIELDPDLLQPSIKNKPNESPEDIEINDEEEILKDVKHNDSEDSSESPMSNDAESGDFDNERSEGESSEENAEGEVKSESEDSEVDPSEEPNQTGESEEAADEEPVSTDNDTDAFDADDEASEAADDEGSASEGNTSEEPEDEFEQGGEAETDEESDIESDKDIEDIDDFDQAFEDDEQNAEENDESEDSLDIDEDDLLDDNLKDTYNDKAEEAKYDARKIKRERTLQAAKNALADAQSKKKAPALIRELEKAIEALESLQEATGKNLRDMSDAEFNLIVNRVFDAIDALGDSGLTYSSDEERQVKAQEIKADIENHQTQAELSAEDVAQIRAETQAIKAREKEADKYKARARGSFKGFQDFLSSLYRAIALQVHTEETRDDSWSAISRRNVGAGVLQQGKKINDLPNKKIPVIDFYFDQSASWNENDIKVGQKAVEALADMEDKGQIKINIYYFSNHVHTDAQSARNEGGTFAWNDIVKNVITTQATNVVIMTDSDMEYCWDYDAYWFDKDVKPASYTVPGYVWYLWRNGSNAPRLTRDLKGRGGTQQFSFN